MSGVGVGGSYSIGERTRMMRMQIHTYTHMRARRQGEPCEELHLDVRPAFT